MKKRQIIVLLVVAVCLVLMTGVMSAARVDPLPVYENITDAQQRLYFRTAIAPPDGTDMVFFWTGSVYMSVPGDIYAPPYPGAPGNFYAHGGGNGGTPLLGFEGYNVRRVLPYIDPATGEVSDTDFILATREIVFYTDPVTGEVLDTWTNPLTGKTTPVVPVLNEYIYFRYRVENGELLGITEISFPVAPGVCQSLELSGPISGPEDLGSDYAWHVDIYPRYRLNDCGRYGIDDPMNLKDGKYTSSEMFDFYTPQIYEFFINREMRSGKVRDWVPQTTLTWVRTGPMLPWMCASENDYEARLVYHVRSELLDDFDDMPEEFKTKMQEYGFPLGGIDYQGWQEAPTTHIHDRPNDTSWSIFYDKVLAPTGDTWDSWCSAFPAQ